MRRLGLLTSLCVAACRGGTPAAAPAPTSAFSVAIEGNCPKLRAHAAGRETVLVVGTYGLDEAGAWTGKQTARAAQAIALVRPTAQALAADPRAPRTATIEPALLEGLPRTSRGWIEGDLEIGGGGRGGFWLERVVRTPAALNKGALFEVSRDGFTWAGRAWRPSAGRDAFLRGPHVALPVATLFCERDGHAFSLLASERASDGTTFVAGRCEDELHRPKGPLLLARYDARAHRWQRVDAPSSALFEGPDAIVNAGIVVVSPDEAWVHAYRPFQETGREHAYLVRVAGTTATPVAVPFERSIVSLARAADGALWTVAGFQELHRRDAGGAWEPAPIALPPLRFVEPVPTSVRLLEVQATARDVWVHGAVPTVRADGSAGREHVLFTTARWSSPLHCDREAEPQTALGSTGTKVKLASLRATTTEKSE
ncbi:MAG: hypothetical protein KIT84_19870 [Labilithrix sp.]|nr:hypothetical protein [Labilithrix sp.]MCW5813296.1 hypothetical protein [Labilithrix sp.]